jgi:hypothetical protein
MVSAPLLVMRKLVLPLSLAINVCLTILALKARIWERPLNGNPTTVSSSVDGSSTGSGSHPAVSSLGKTKKTHLRSAPAPTSPPPVFDWQQVESPDYRTYVANLRSIGCPKQTIRDIITADVNQAFAQRRGQLVASEYGPFQYWNTKPQPADLVADYTRQKEELDGQRRNTLQTLLGSDYVDGGGGSWAATEADYRLSFLPDDLRQKVREVNLRYEEIEPQIKSLADWQSQTKDPEQLQNILDRYASKKAELAQLLTPEQFEQYDMTVSWTADNLRQAMVHFNPTPEEFRIIFQEWRAQDEMLAELRAHNEPDPGNAQVFENIKKALGDERFAEYQRTWWK